jgi:acetamidase/formamidase
VFSNPAALGTGLLPQDFAQGQIKYVDLDLTAMQRKFAPDINIPLTPFQGTLGVAPPDGPPVGIGGEPHARRLFDQLLPVLEVHGSILIELSTDGGDAEIGRRLAEEMRLLRREHARDI